MMVCTKSDLVKLRKTGQQMLFPPVLRITVGQATCGIAKGADKVFAAIKKELKKQKLEAVLESVGCGGWCSREPIVTFQMPGLAKLTLGEVTARDVPGLIRQVKSRQIPSGRVLYRTDDEANIIDGSIRAYATGKGRAAAREVPAVASVPFMKKQKRIVLRNCGVVDPGSFEQYCGRGGFSAAYTALVRMKPDQVVNEVIRSGLRGRGGAGFPTGEKWRIARQAPGKKKFIVCNADEGDPGAYMDRSILEGDPFSVLEGMLIAACAIGASEGFVYVRNEYPCAVAMMTGAISIAKKRGMLGRNIFGTGFNFTVHVEQGAGAFVCGEETALIASLEGRAGEPQPRPPYPAQQGLWGMPTCINNVETLANIPVIISRGGPWFSRMGTGKSRGTKIFSLVGAVENVGLIEVPMGTRLRDIIYGLGGGPGRGRKFKAVQTGGPSGGCIPARLLDLPVDYESLAAAGSIMGSGGMIVMDDRTCMVDVAKYFMAFLKEESCGKCLPCREGTRAVLEILEKITSGAGKMQDVDRLKDVCEAMSEASLCALGRTAAHPVLSTLKHFRHEYEAHIKKRRCPAGVCTSLIKFSVSTKKCIGCGACKKACPAGAVSGKPKKAHSILSSKCIACRACFEACPVEAIEIR